MPCALELSPMSPAVNLPPFFLRPPPSSTKNPFTLAPPFHGAQVRWSSECSPFPSRCVRKGPNVRLPFFFQSKDSRFPLSLQHGQLFLLAEFLESEPSIMMRALPPPPFRKRKKSSEKLFPLKEGEVVFSCHPFFHEKTSRKETPLGTPPPPLFPSPQRRSLLNLPISMDI